MLPVDRTTVYRETFALANMNIEQIRQNLQTLGVDADPGLEAIFQRIMKDQNELQGYIKLLVNGPYLLSTPDDCLKVVFRCLSIENVFRCALVCKSLNQKMKTEDICSAVYFHNFPKHPKPKSLSSYEACKRAAFTNQLRDIYSTKIKTSNFNNNEFIVCNEKIFQSNIMKSGIEVYDLNTKMLVSSINCPQKCAQAFARSGREVYLSFRSSIGILDAETREYLGDFPKGNNTIYSSSLAVSDRTLYAGGNNGFIDVWDLDTKKYSHSFEASSSSVFSLLASEKRLYSGHWDGMVRIWDLNKGPEFLRILSGSKSKVCFLAAFQKTLCSSHQNGDLKFWDLSTRECLHTSNEGYRDFPIIVFYERLYSAVPNMASVKVWDEKGKCLQIVKQDDVVNHFVASEGNLFSSFVDGVKKWDFTSEYLSLVDLAGLFREGKEDSVETAMSQFSELSDDVKNGIYGKLYLILKPTLENDYFGCAENAFYGRHELSSTPEQKAQAIEDFAARDL